MMRGPGDGDASSHPPASILRSTGRRSSAPSSRIISSTASPGGFFAGLATRCFGAGLRCGAMVSKSATCASAGSPAAIRRQRIHQAAQTAGSR